ncbi:MAG: FAD-dependent oxidoreductase, partial [Deltaproteobacteria bacterium]|nr:FAD-dependent oxidoreductase [Deltaproteobacteria bacterium]
MKTERCDLLVVGGGPGGYTAAMRAAVKGLRVILAEKGPMGGTCLNRGCLPTKALLEDT